MDSSKRTKKAQAPVITLDDGRVKKEPAEPVPSQVEAKLREELEKTKKNLQKAVRIAGEHLQGKEILEGIIDKKRVKIEPIEDPEKAHLRRVLKKKDEQLRESRRIIAEMKKKSEEEGRGTARTESRVSQGERPSEQQQLLDDPDVNLADHDIGVGEMFDDSIDERLDEGMRSGENNLNEVNTGSIGGERVGRPRRSTVGARVNESSEDSESDEEEDPRVMRSKAAKKNGKSPSQAGTQKRRSSPTGSKNRGVKKNAKISRSDAVKRRATSNDRPDSAMKKSGMDKENDTDLECIECEFHTRYISSYYNHLRWKHSTNPALAGITLRCDCGLEFVSHKHVYSCEIANFTVIRIGEGPIRRIDDAKTTPKCVLCEAYPKTATGYACHLYKIHKCSLIANGVYLKCGCSFEITSYSIGTDHKKECDERQFTLHKVNED